MTRGAPNAAPYWWEQAPPESVSDTVPAPVCDVVVVGAGYAGLGAALTLARAGRSVQVFDRQRPGEGASTRNGGIASGNLHISFAAMIRAFGVARATAVYAEGKAAREDLARFLANEGIECDFQAVGRFTGAVRAAHYETLAREAELLERHLGIGAYAVPRAEQHLEIGSEFYHGGVVRPDIGGLHPGKLHAGLLARVRDAGARVLGRTAVLDVRRERGGFDVTTARGRVRAADVVVATNGYGDESDAWLRRRLVPAASRIIATEPLRAEVMSRALPRSRMMGETRRLFHYYRPSPDRTRILFGGRDTPWRGREAQATADLARHLVALFPELRGVAISHSWNGNVAFNRDRLPRLFVRDGVHYAVGFCGSGVVWARWLGTKAALRILGDADARSAFEGEPPRAVPLYRGRPWFLPLTQAWMGARDRFDRLRA